VRRTGTVSAAGAVIHAASSSGSMLYGTLIPSAALPIRSVWSGLRSEPSDPQLTSGEGAMDNDKTHKKRTARPETGSLI
jgi:hypothetical protein